MLTSLFYVVSRSTRKNWNLSFSASDENATIRVKYANNPEEGPDTVSTISPLEKFNIPGQKKNFPIDTNPSENYNSTNNDTPTTQDILQGIILLIFCFKIWKVVRFDNKCNLQLRFLLIFRFISNSSSCAVWSATAVDHTDCTGMPVQKVCVKQFYQLVESVFRQRC